MIGFRRSERTSVRKDNEYHGYTKGGKQRPEYQVWSQIVERCFNRKHPKYKRYGGRGIGMYLGWRDSFKEFLYYMGPRPGKGYSIGRVNNDKGYVPGNVRWETPEQQARNTKTNRFVTVNGKKMCLSQLADEHKLDRRLVRNRIESGLTPEEAVSKPRERGDRFFVIGEETHSTGVWAHRLNISPWTMYYRLDAGWPLDRVFGRSGVREVFFGGPQRKAAQ